MFEIALPVLQIAWMGIVTTLFEFGIDILYMCYDGFWMGFLGGICDAFTNIPGIGPIVDTIWGMIA